MCVCVCGLLDMLTTDSFALSLSLSLPPSLPLIASNPSYYPPFDGWVSNNPSIDEMKRVVVDEGKRPLISPKFQTNLVSWLRNKLTCAYAAANSMCAAKL